MNSPAKKFVKEYWFDGNNPSEAVTKILGWIEDGKLTKNGRMNYRKLVKNLQPKPTISEVNKIWNNFTYADKLLILEKINYRFL